jgi:hypothetical protein
MTGRHASDGTGARDAWTERLLAAVRTAAGDEWVDSARALWGRTSASPEVRVTLYGPYDAGKSTLLKRLLVEDGTPVPDWLRIGARPTTDECREVASGGFRYIDTPGFAARAGDREPAADAAITTSDVLMVVLTPQVTAEAGTYVAPLLPRRDPGQKVPVPFSAKSLLLVFAKAETAGPYPDDDPDEFTRLWKRKRAELARLLTEHGCVAPLPGIHVVIADLDGNVGMAGDARSDDYAAGYGRTVDDGIGALCSALGAVAASGHELRATAYLRYWATLARQALERSIAEQDHLEETERAAERERGLLTSVVAQLDALDQRAATELRTQVARALEGIADAAAARDPAGLRDAARERLTEVVQAWSRTWHNELEQLVVTTTAEIGSRAALPTTETHHDFLKGALEGLAPASPAPADPGSFPALAAGLGHAVRRTSYTAYTRRVGASPGEVRARLQRARHASFLGYPPDARETAFLSHAREELWYADLADLVPTLLGLASLVWRAAREKQRTLQEAERRRELRTELRKRAEVVTGKILDSHWNPAVRTIHDQLHDRMPPESLLEEVRNRRSALAGAVAELRACLEESRTWP